MQTQESTRYRRLSKLLSDLYGEKGAKEFRARFVKLIESCQIPPRVHTMSQRDVILIAYPDHIRSKDRLPLQALDYFCNTKLVDLINTVHILPHYPFTSDDGFAVSDYTVVDRNYGTWSDVHSLGKNFRLMFDAVFNHTSASHMWFQGFLENNSRYRNYYIELDRGTNVSSVVRPRTTPLLTAFVTDHGIKHLWTTFSSDQVDLNFANPKVLYDLTEILLSYISHGADLIRLDAIAFVWKELGTNSIHHPKTHTTIRFMREVIHLTSPWVQLVTETNVPQEENLSYFGNGHNEANLIYNFALPPLVLHTMQTENANKLSEWASEISTPSDETFLFNFTASHDGIGVRAVEKILTVKEVESMSVKVLQRGGNLSMKTGPGGKDDIYEMNCTFFDAVTDPSLHSKTQIDQFICSQAIALSLAGVPGIYLHSLVGSRNWGQGVKQTGHNRTINRQKLNLSILEQELQDKGSERSQVFKIYSHLLKIRRTRHELRPDASQKVLDFGSGVFALERDDRLLAIHNVTSKQKTINIPGVWKNLITNNLHEESVVLQPFQVAWLIPDRENRDK